MLRGRADKSLVAPVTAKRVKTSVFTLWEVVVSPKQQRVGTQCMATRHDAPWGLFIGMRMVKSVYIMWLFTVVTPDVAATSGSPGRLMNTPTDGADFW